MGVGVIRQPWIALNWFNVNKMRRDVESGEYGGRTSGQFSDDKGCGGDRQGEDEIRKSGMGSEVETL